MDYRIIDKIEDLNCTTCLCCKSVDGYNICFYPQDIDARQEVDESDFCEEAGRWLLKGTRGVKEVSRAYAIECFIGKQFPQPQEDEVSSEPF
jgi:hypothetical protein